MEALFRAYFTEGRDISNRQTLIDVVAEAGLERQRAEAVLNSNDGLEAIKEAEGCLNGIRWTAFPFSSSTKRSRCRAHSSRMRFLRRSSRWLARNDGFPSFPSLPPFNSSIMGRRSPT